MEMDKVLGSVDKLKHLQPSHIPMLPGDTYLHVHTTVAHLQEHEMAEQEVRDKLVCFRQYLSELIGWRTLEEHAACLRDRETNTLSFKSAPGFLWAVDMDRVPPLAVRGSHTFKADVAQNLAQLRAPTWFLRTFLGVFKPPPGMPELYAVPCLWAKHKEPRVGLDSDPLPPHLCQLREYEAGRRMRVLNGVTGLNQDRHIILPGGTTGQRTFARGTIPVQQQEWYQDREHTRSSTQQFRTNQPRVFSEEISTDFADGRREDSPVGTTSFNGPSFELTHSS